MGFDIELVNKLNENISIPLIIHGGAGKFNHISELLKKTNCNSIALSSILHYDTNKSKLQQKKHRRRKF